MSFWSIIIAILVLGALVFFHEFGHFIFAKKAGIGVTEFSIGMGPRLFSFDRGETKYSLKAIPFGGSCAMVGEDADSLLASVWRPNDCFIIYIIGRGNHVRYLSQLHRDLEQITAYTLLRCFNSCLDHSLYDRGKVIGHRAAFQIVNVEVHGVLNELISCRASVLLVHLVYCFHALGSNVKSVFYLF